MKKPRKLSLAERQARILQIAETSYQSPFDAAQDYLGAIDGATPGNQKILFRQVLSTHRSLKITREQAKTKKNAHSGQFVLARRKTVGNRPRLGEIYVAKEWFVG